MRKVLPFALCCMLLSACVTNRQVSAPAPWDRRVAALQASTSWDMDGRAAVALGSQGWQASLNWRETGAQAELHLTGPLGVGATVLKETPDGLSLNGAAPSTAVVQQLEDRLGFDLPIDELKYWLLGVPDPGTPCELSRNAQDRAAQMTQGGWVLTYDRYMSVGGDLLPARLVMTREDVRVRIVMDRWEGVR